MSQEKKTIKRIAMIALSTERYAEYSKILGAAAQAMGEIKIRKQAADVEFKNESKEHELIFAKAITVINEGVEEREVECVEVKDFKHEKVQYVFEGKVVEERAMTDDDRQGELLTQDAVKKAKARKVKNTDDDESVKSVIKMETNKRTKRDASVG